MKRALLALLASAAYIRGSEAQLRANVTNPECAWFKQALMSGRAKELTSNPRFVQLQAICEKFYKQWSMRKGASGPEEREAEKAEAYMQKEAIEDKCAWYHKSTDSLGVGGMFGEDWYKELKALCSGVPIAEIEDNLIRINDQKCTWFEMAKLSGRLDRYIHQPWYTDLQERCKPLEDDTKRQAVQVASKLKGQYNIAGRLFNKLPENIRNQLKNPGKYGKFDRDANDPEMHPESVLLGRGFKPRQVAGASPSEDHSNVPKMDDLIQV
eukprot:TRINITY_DN76135_c0_g1_i1.p1 TRINITY_DN76135_c0_g1~~TRINITY_DN76135_c0_g1_i1.p1  ORF type:complete len:268 (-),score=77.27 TRINITY_DN76135_c0_g1_i1:152-955(-)